MHELFFLYIKQMTMCTLAYATSGCETNRGCLVSGSLMDDVEVVFLQMS